MEGKEKQGKALSWTKSRVPQRVSRIACASHNNKQDLKSSAARQHQPAALPFSAVQYVLVEVSEVRGMHNSSRTVTPSHPSAVHLASTLVLKSSWQSAGLPVPVPVITVSPVRLQWTTCTASQIIIITTIGRPCIYDYISTYVGCRYQAV